MTRTLPRNRPPLFVVIACVLSAIIFGSICWDQTLRSDAATTTGDYLFLILYECLSLISYLALLWYFARLTKFRGGETVIALFLISAGGTGLPYLASSIRIWTKHQSEPGWFLRQSAVAWLILNIGMLIFMFLVAGFGFILTRVFQHQTATAPTSG